jgi:hypothetical protein
MSTGNNYTVEGLGDGDMSWPKDFKLKNSSGTALFSVDSTGVTAATRTGVQRFLNVGAKVGATAGATVAHADNKASLFRVPASQTASTVVIPVTGLKVGDIVTSFHLNGQIESAGNTCTLDAELRKMTAVAADNSDAAITDGSIVQVSVTADTLLSSANTAPASMTAETLAAGESLYILVTVTTAASTDVDCINAVVTVTEA